MIFYFTSDKALHLKGWKAVISYSHTEAIGFLYCSSLLQKQFGNMSQGSKTFICFSPLIQLLKTFNQEVFQNGKLKYQLSMSIYLSIKSQPKYHPSSPSCSRILGGHEKLYPWKYFMTWKNVMIMIGLRIKLICKWF